MSRLGQAPPAIESYIAKNFFTYNVGLASGDTLAPAGTTSLSFNIDGDSDFFWTKLAAYAQIGNDGEQVATEELAAVTIVITNNSNGRQYMNEAVPLTNIAGNGRLPFILPMVTYWARKTTITLDLVNITDNQTFTQLEISFIGIKAFSG
jgi:hypothetical protein